MRHRLLYLRRRIIPIIILLLALLLSAQSSGNHRVVRQELDGIPFVRTEGGPKYDGPLFKVTHDLVLGIDEGEPEWQQFVQSPKFLVAPDGKMVLADFRRAEIFIVDKEGNLLVRTGREGAGPGEFKSMMRILWAEFGKEFWIQDNDLLRITRFSMEGELLGTINYGSQLPNGHSLQSLGEGTFICSLESRNDRERRSEWWFVDNRLNRINTFPQLLDPSATWEGSAAAILPYASVTHIKSSLFNQYLLVNPHIGRLTIFTADSKPLIHIEREWDNIPITTSEKRQIRTLWRDEWGGHWLEYWDKIPIPDHRPPFALAQIDDMGHIWVEHFAGPYSQFIVRAEFYTFDVFDSDGTWLGSQVFPYNRLLIQGGYAYRTYLSEYGAPRFERIKLMPLVPELEKHEK